MTGSSHPGISGYLYRIRAHLERRVWMTLRAEIVGGPGKWDFLTSFGNRTQIELTITYKNGVKDKILLLVNAIGHEDGSGHSWLIERAHVLHSQAFQFNGATAKGWYPTKGHREGLARDLNLTPAHQQRRPPSLGDGGLLIFRCYCGESETACPPLEERMSVAGRRYAGFLY